MQRSAFCRSRRELSNAYFLAKFRFDTAEKEPFKVCPIERCGQPFQACEQSGRYDAAELAGRRLAQFRLHELYTARSRPYRSEILQENMRLKVLAEIYTMHSFAQLYNLNFLSKFTIFFATY